MSQEASAEEPDSLLSSQEMDAPSRESQVAHTVAGVDLGSNSFHMVVVRREEDGKIQVLDKLREPVRLAAGLTKKGELTLDAQKRGWAALEKMGERLREFPRHAVRAVGTNTLRQAKNGNEFLMRGQELLGHRIEVIAGPEEARLIFVGVAHSDFAEGRRLVIDIGGGSTEFIIGEGFEPNEKHSLYMGCVSFSQRFFGEDKITKTAFEEAELAAANELRSIRESFRKLGWQSAWGASGTIRAVDEISRANGWSAEKFGLEQLERMRDELIGQHRISKLDLKGLEPDRAPVFPGGLAVLMAAFRSLAIDEMTSASGALREGLAFELLGVRSRADVRERTVTAFEERYHTDQNHARAVEATALDLFDQLAEPWELDDATGRRMLEFASRLHEIGKSIAYAGYHKHDAYIIKNAEMPGFSRGEQEFLAAILRGHRRKIKKKYFKKLPKDQRTSAIRLATILRVAIALHRSRSVDLAPEIKVAKATDERLDLRFPTLWLREHVLVRTDLEGEAEFLENVGLDLTFV